MCDRDKSKKTKKSQDLVSWPDFDKVKRSVTGQQDSTTNPLGGLRKDQQVSKPTSTKKEKEE